MASGPGKVARLGPSARKVYLLVRDALERNVPLQAALSETLLSLKLSEEVRRQATDLVYTAVRSEVRCLYVLHRIYPKFGHFPKVVQRLLVAACAALLFQEKAPAYAIVHETVADISFLCGKGMGRTRGTGTIFLPSCVLRVFPKKWEGFSCASSEKKMHERHFCRVSRALWRPCVSIP